MHEVPSLEPIHWGILLRTHRICPLWKIRKSGTGCSKHCYLNELIMRSTRLVFYDFITKYTKMFCCKKLEKLFHCKSFSHFFNKKYWHIWEIIFWKFSEMLTNDVVSFEQLGPDLQVSAILPIPVAPIPYLFGYKLGFPSLEWAPNTYLSLMTCAVRMMDVSLQKRVKKIWIHLPKIPKL